MKEQYLTIVIRLLLAVAASAMVGVERTYFSRPAEILGHMKSVHQFGIALTQTKRAGISCRHCCDYWRQHLPVQMYLTARA